MTHNIDFLGDEFDASVNPSANPRSGSSSSCQRDSFRRSNTNFMAIPADLLQAEDENIKSMVRNLQDIQTQADGILLQFGCIKNDLEHMRDEAANLRAQKESMQKNCDKISAALDTILT